MKTLRKCSFPLLIISICLFESVLNFLSCIFREFQAALISTEWLLLICITIWCGTFIFLTFSRSDFPVMSLLLITIIAFFSNYVVSQSATDAITLLAGVLLGKGVGFALKKDGNWSLESGTKVSSTGLLASERRTFLVGLVMVLTFSSSWHLDMDGIYRGPRWMGLWDNPNLYGMLMGAGLLLAVGLLAEMRKSVILKTKIEEGSKNNKQNPSSRCLCAGRAESRNVFLLFVRFFASKRSWFLIIATGMIAVGLVMSYSRGAWTATVVALLYLAWAYGKLKWQFVLPVVLIAATIVAMFWHTTADTAPWYLKRLDFSRPSAQHRVSAWRGAMQMMRDHPFGVGWNRALSVYDKNYSPPEGSAAALTMNSYLMLGTVLGLPGLLCFIAYIYLKFKPKVADPIQVTCRAGALVLLVAFWFDGGLFELPTAAVFWILLELGNTANDECARIGGHRPPQQL